jgi:glycosyltransferase involved in cell wall biosynthesis
VRIVFLSPTGELGGAEVALLELLAGIREACPSWPLHLVVASDGLLADRAGARGVPATVLPFPVALARLGEWGRRGGLLDRAALLGNLCRAAGPAAAYARRLRTLLYDLQPDVVHSNGLKMHVLGSWARPADSALIWHLHDYPGARPVAARLLRRCLGACAGVITNSASVAEDARAVLGEAIAIHPVHNAVDLERFRPDGPALDLDAAAGLSPAGPGTVRVGMVGAFARWKGHETFIRAMASLPPDLPVRGYIIGGPLYQTDRSQYSIEELRAAAEEAGVSACVGFTGIVSETPAAYRALDVVVHASTEPEPFGLVVVEAMACGRPVVTTGAGGVAELVAGEVNALIYPPGDAAGLADCITRLAADAELRDRLGKAGHEMAFERFTRVRLSSALVPIYEAAVSPS